MFVSYNEKSRIIKAVSKDYFKIPNYKTVEFEQKTSKSNLIGLKIDDLLPQKQKKDLKIACICNWNDACGISTYTRYLIEEISKKTKDVLILSERNENPTFSDTDKVIRCWKRGESMKECLDILEKYNPDLTIVQHEFGIFPKATFFLTMLQELKKYKYIVTLHSVYEHLDKTICTSAIENIVVHTEEGKKCLRKLGHNQKIFVIPHGVVKYENVSELWNIFQVPYVVVQFGFGFFYKGVDRAIDAIHYLKNHDKKFEDIFYLYLCSDSGHFNYVFNEYYEYLLDKIDKLKLKDNVSIIRKFNTEETINNYLRCAKIAIFPYITNPNHVVYGASGAIRIAMANNIPVLASEGHMFDDLEGVLPRPKNHIELAKEIDKIFSNEQYKKSLLLKTENYCKDNTWEKIAEKYLDLYYEIS